MIDKDVALEHLERVIEHVEATRECLRKGRYVEARSRAQAAIDDWIAVVVATSQQEGAAETKASSS